MPRPTLAKKKKIMSTPPTQSNPNPLGFHFSIPPTMSCFHRLLCNSVLHKCWAEEICFLFEPAPSGFMGFLLLIALKALQTLSSAKGWDEQANSSRVGTASVWNWSLPAALPPLTVCWLQGKGPEQSSPGVCGRKLTGPWPLSAAAAGNAHGGWTRQWNPSGLLWCKTVIETILVELGEASVYLGITHVSPPSFLYSGSAPI